MQLTPNGRLEKFQELTAAERAALLREQAVRWRRLHAERLTPEQNQLLEQMVEFIQPELFEGRRHNEDLIKTFMSLEEKISGAFTSEESLEAFTLRGSYLPPQ
jgi:hypothetical protein